MPLSEQTSRLAPASSRIWADLCAPADAATALRVEGLDARLANLEGLLLRTAELRPSRVGADDMMESAREAEEKFGARVPRAGAPPESRSHDLVGLCAWCVVRSLGPPLDALRGRLHTGNHPGDEEGRRAAAPVRRLHQSRGLQERVDGRGVEVGYPARDRPHTYELS